MASGDHDKAELDPRIDLFAGSAAGIAGLAVGFPFDTVKVRLQNPELASKYRSTFHAFGKIIREERIHGLFRGITSPLVTVAPLNGAVFAGYKFLVKVQLDNVDVQPTLTQVTLAGIGCGVVASVVTSPMELLKVQQQCVIVPKGHPAPTVVDVARNIIRQRGIAGLYRGFFPTTMRETGYGAYFGVYEGMLMLLAKISSGRYRDLDPSTSSSEAAVSKAKHSTLDFMLAGGIAGVASWLVTFPFDVIKTRVQSVVQPAANHPYRNMLSTIVNSYREEGYKVFFHGLKPTIIRAIPVNMVTFATFETVVRTLT